MTRNERYAAAALFLRGLKLAVKPAGRATTGPGKSGRLIFGKAREQAVIAMG